MQAKYQRGLTLLEVMIAVVVFSIGLLGVGALMTSSIRGNHIAFQRTQAMSLAASMEARMSRNSIGTWAGRYNGTFGATGAGECDTISCSPTDLATADSVLWGSQVADILPNGTGTIFCESAVALPAGADGYPPYRGRCLITIRWAELGDIGSANAETTQVFSYFAQP